MSGQETLTNRAGVVVFEGTTSESGGSQPTDEVVQFTSAGVQPTLLSIVAVDQAGGTFSVAGDQTEFFPFTGTDLLVSGSTGNDGFYAPTGGVTYDSGSDRTIIDTGSPLPDATADGDLQGSVIYKAEIVLPANSAIEWGEVLTDTNWEGGGAGAAYWSMGDDDDPYAFTGDNGAGTQLLASPGRWQWPTSTLHTPDTSSDFTTYKQSLLPMLPGGNLTDYKLYPAGTTITILAAVDALNDQGSTRFVVHHHFTEPVVPTINPPA